MNVEEAIKTSIEYETKVRDVYAQALKKATDPVGKKIFQVLAAEEQHHVDFLKKKLLEWKESGVITSDELQTAIPSREVIEKGVSQLQKKMTDEDHGEEVKMLQKALETEIAASTFYKKMVEELPAEDRKLFDRFVEIEEGHVAIVQAELDAVLGLGFWFDFQEFSLEAG